jgi:hypothetical protein
MFNVRVMGADMSARTTAVDVELLVCTAAARLFTVSAYNGTDGTVYLQAFDSAAAPADDAVPKLVTTVYTKSSGGFNFSDGAIFAAGIYLCFSSTDTKKTVCTDDTGLLDATYRLR